MRLLLLPLVAALAVAGFAQTGMQKRPMTFADLQAMKRVSDPQISPSGKWVLFSVTDVSLEKNSKVNHLWVVALGGDRAQGSGSSEERELTSGTGETGGRFSPDGKWVMYSSRETGTGQIWMAPWDDAAGVMGAGHQVTSLETEADGAIWTPDSKHFLFVSEVYPECESHAAIGVARNEEEANCNAAKDVVAAKSPVKAMLFTSLLYRHWDHYQGAKRSHIFYGSVEGGAGAPTDLTPASVIGDHVAPTFSLGGPMGYAISPDGKEIAYVVNLDKVPAESTNNDIYTVQVGAEPSTAKKVSTSPGSDDGPAYSPDGKWLAWRSQARNGFESDKFDLVIMDRSNSSINNLTSKFDSWVDEFAWTSDSKNLYFASPIEGRELVFKLAPKEGGIGELTFNCSSSFIDCEKAEFGGIQVAPDSKRLLMTRMSVKGPSELVVTSPSERACASCWGAIDRDDTQKPWDVYRTLSPILVDLEPLTKLNDVLLSTLDLPFMEHFWFTGAANTEVEGFMIRPPGFDASKKYPVKFVMHGGPQTALGDGWSYRWNPELMAADGYVVVMINRRGSTGYGQKFVDEVSGDWGGKAYVDLMKGLDYAEKTYPFIDKERECALGASYGGFMANWVLTHTDRFKCIVTHDGMYNPQSAFGTTEEDWFNEWEFRPAAANGVGVEQTKAAYPWDYFDKSNEDDPFRKWSPMLHIKNAKTPTLVIHGQRDYRLDVSEGLQLFDSLQMLGVPSEMLYFQDEGHWVLKPKDSELWYRTVNDWCDRWTGTNGYAAVGPAVNPMAVAAAKR
jgi:dipeptidyl aminopeptidase/acylaminoacyl peptidase